MVKRTIQIACGLLIALLCSACNRSYRPPIGEARMLAAQDRLKHLQQPLGGPHEARSWSRLGMSVSQANGLMHVDYYGHYGEEALEPVFHTLCRPKVAKALGALSFAGDDDGANGTKAWGFTSLLNRKVNFPHLHTLSIELYDRENHNHPIVTAGEDEEGGQLARWLDCAPRLTTLSTPSAPNARFFRRPAHPLRVLRVQAGYATQQFIPNLARSTCFPALQELDWSEIEADDQDAEFAYSRMQDRKLGFHVDAAMMKKLRKLNEELKAEGAPTSFQQFEALLRSRACPPNVTLRDPILTGDQVARLYQTFKSSHPGGSLAILSPHTDPYWGPISKGRQQFVLKCLRANPPPRDPGT
jgi:hypothetical protein